MAGFAADTTDPTVRAVLRTSRFAAISEGPGQVAQIRRTSYRLTRKEK
jgi:hypothetical protein